MRATDGFTWLPRSTLSRIFMNRHFNRLAFFIAAFAINAVAAELTFERDVRPILKKHCFMCHGEGEKLKGGVDLRLRRLMLGKTKDGEPVLTPGKPAESEIVLVLRHGEMPEKGKPLAPQQIALIEQWVAQGAKTARAEPAEVPKYFITEEEREFWAFQPIQRPAVPKIQNSKFKIQNPIDAFLLAKLADRKSVV